MKDDAELDGEDCVWVADFGWTSDLTETQTTAVPVPYAWLLANCPDAVDEYDVYEAVAKQPAANGRLTVADCYVAGLDPNAPAAEFKAVIEMVDGAPVVMPSPDLKGARVYKVSGRTALDDAEGGSVRPPRTAGSSRSRSSCRRGAAPRRLRRSHGGSGRGGGHLRNAGGTPPRLRAVLCGLCVRRRRRPAPAEGV